MKIAVFGPNLPGIKAESPQLHAHAADCADCKKRTYTARGVDEPMVMDVETVKDVVTDIYPPSNFLYDADDPEELAIYIEEIRFFPCTKELGR